MADGSDAATAIANAAAAVVEASMATMSAQQAEKGCRITWKCKEPPGSTQRAWGAMLAAGGGAGDKFWANARREA